MMIDAAGFSPEIIAGKELPVIDDQLAVQQVQLFYAGMAMGRIFSSRCQPYEHADTVLFGISREHLVGDAGPRQCPLRLDPALWREGDRLPAGFLGDTLRKAIPKRSRGTQHVGRPVEKGIENRTKRLNLVSAFRTGRDVCSNLGYLV